MKPVFGDDDQKNADVVSGVETQTENQETAFASATAWKNPRIEAGVHAGSWGLQHVLGEWGPQVSVGDVNIGGALVPTGMDATTLGNMYLGSVVGVLMTNGLRVLTSEKISWAKAAIDTTIDLACAGVATAAYFGVNAWYGRTAEDINNNGDNGEEMMFVQVAGPSIVRGLAKGLGQFGLYAANKCREKVQAFRAAHSGDSYAQMVNDNEAPAAESEAPRMGFGSSNV
jgi:hypothetical protein